MSAKLNLEELLNKIDLVTLAERTGTQLVHKTGRDEYRGKCPLHAGDNPTSFQIYTADGGCQRWRCWADCDTGGDAIEFIMRIENLAFIEAVKWLVEYAGMSLEEIGFTPEVAKAAKEHRQRVDILDLAARYYVEQLWSEAGKHALEYARSRGFSDEIIRVAGFGFSAGGTGLKDYLENEDAARGLEQIMALARKTGLIRADGQDFTSNSGGDKVSPAGWLIYTHRDYVGLRRSKCDACQDTTWHDGGTCLRHSEVLPQIKGVTYLSARALNPVEPGDKSRNLPGRRRLYKAEVPGVREVILCEGQTDAESYRQWGFSAWALCGLGQMPETDLRALKQRPVIYLALDGDDEGQKKKSKLAPALGPLTMLVESFRDAKDANEFLKNGGTAPVIHTMLRDAIPVIDERLERVKIATPHELQALTGEIMAMLDELPNELKPHYMKRAQRTLGMDRKDLRALMNETDQLDGDVPILSGVKDGRLHFLGEPLANFTAQITHELVIDDGLNLPEVQYTVAGWLATGEPLRVIDVPAEEFPEMKWIHRYWGARPILYAPRGKYYQVARAMQETSLDDMGRDRVFTHTGWTVINGVRGYLTRSGMITAKGFDGSVRVDLGENNLRYYDLPKPPAGDELAEAVKASLGFLDIGPLRVTAPLWAALYASPLTEIRPLYTVIWLYGPTQSGKSTVGHLALAHFGTGFIEGRQYHAPVDWMSTVTHIEGVMFKVKDAPVIIDDFAPQFQSAADSRRIHKSAHQIVRAVGNRSARGRANRDLSERKTRIPRGMAISTAELPLAGESTVGRMVYVPIVRGEVLPNTGEPPRKELDRAQAQARGGSYAQAMAAYVQWLATNWERASKLYLEIIEESHKLVREGKMQNRLPDYFATLDSAQQVALTAFSELGLLSAHEAAKIAERNGQAILGVIENQAEKIAAESPVRKFFDALDNLLQRRKVYLEPRSGATITPINGAEPVGWYEPGDENIFYLDTSSCMIHVRDFWAQLGEHFDTTRDALHRQFNQISDLLSETGGGNNIQVSKWVTSAGKNKRMIAFCQEKVQALYGVTIRNPSPPPIQPGEKPDHG